jgi:hypothetical protein
MSTIDINLLPVPITLKMTRGTDPIWDIALEEDGEPYSLAGCSIVLTVREQARQDATLVYTATADIADPDSGVATIEIDGSEPFGDSGTVRYFCDIRLIDAQGKAMPIAAGPFIVRDTPGPA